MPPSQSPRQPSQPRPIFSYPPICLKSSRMPFRQHTLDNGLEIVAETSPDAYSSAFAFFVRTGVRDETSDISGVSHFLEHMVFKGSANRSAADVNRDLDDLTASSNAYTSEEQTFISERRCRRIRRKSSSSWPT